MRSQEEIAGYSSENFGKNANFTYSSGNKYLVNVKLK